MLRVRDLAASALALSFGALYPQFGTENAAQIPTSFGGLVYMMSSLSLPALVIMIEAVPVTEYLREQRFANQPAGITPRGSPEPSVRTTLPPAMLADNPDRRRGNTNDRGAFGDRRTRTSFTDPAWARSFRSVSGRAPG